MQVTETHYAYLHFHFELRWNCLIQSISQSKFYSTTEPGCDGLSGTTAKLVFNSNIDKAVPQHQQACSNAHAACSMTSWCHIYTDTACHNRDHSDRKLCLFQYISDWHLKLTWDLNDWVRSQPHYRPSSRQKLAHITIQLPFSSFSLITKQSHICCKKTENFFIQRKVSSWPHINFNKLLARGTSQISPDYRSHWTTCHQFSRSEKNDRIIAVTVDGLLGYIWIA